MVSFPTRWQKRDPGVEQIRGGDDDARGSCNAFQILKVRNPGVRIRILYLQSAGEHVYQRGVIVNE
jgi:hypothetical protein